MREIVFTPGKVVIVLEAQFITGDVGLQALGAHFDVLRNSCGQNLGQRGRRGDCLIERGRRGIFRFLQVEEMLFLV